VALILEETNRLRGRWDVFKAENQNTATFAKGALWLAVTGKLGGLRKVFSIGKTIYDGIKVLPDAFRPNGPRGLTLATPNGSTVTGALEGATAVPVGVEGTAATAIGATAAGVGALPPNDINLSLSLRKEKTDGQRDIGSTGSYKDLTDGTGTGGFQDGKEAHHIPSRKFIEKHGVKDNDGLAVIMTKEQHAETRTYRGKSQKIDLNNSFRNETALDIKDYIEILKKDNLYTPEVRQSLMQGLDDFKAKFPQLLEKVNKK
jgi:hypothetical protein